ncbi:MAG: DUF1593 domain-containing protein [Bacteroidales bacterium]|nr:DUF1593 domain-containing protein [Bacteroidales bacterium]
MRKFFLAISVATALMFVCNSADAEKVRPRTIVTTDGEVDDMDSFIRILLYANDLQIEGIVYSASQFHWSGDGKGTLLLPRNKANAGGFGFGGGREPVARESYRWLGLTWIQDYIDLYAQVYPNLVKHDKNYPTPEYLQSIVKVGNVMVEGDMENPTEGSDFIKSILLDDKPGPVYIQVWGGPNTAARALLSIEEEYKNTPQWDEIYKKVSQKAILNCCLEQDGTYRNYIAKNWPDLRCAIHSSQWTSFAYGWTSGVPQPYLKYLQGEWFKENILFNHGPLAAEYHTWGDGRDIGDPEGNFFTEEDLKRSGRTQYDFISEGDSPTYTMLFDFGLRSLEHFEWGSMGGRLPVAQAPQAGWNDGSMRGGFGRPRGAQAQPEEKIEFDRTKGDYSPFTESVNGTFSMSRWVPVLQNDFAARADWCVMPYKDANHQPVAKVAKLDRTVQAGKKVSLKGKAKDPDKDTLTYKWWQYREAGTYDGKVELKNADSKKASFVIPADAPSGSTIHLILEVTDNGTPALTHFQRVIVTVK